ncbi:RCC1-like G exchanging factor-like protein [Actinia tenebrosa]|uniref:RCC1-like G exchanging factor-like protein n=1 Tax=Actinia tenebrosa TaxID=6105 RepID=A0A6P8HN89_ACTTE|nr:RCC1-like G exchanging factor-like protein [Actinia tenebrosa]
MVGIRNILIKSLCNVQALKYHSRQRIFKVRYAYNSTLAYVWGAGDGGQLARSTSPVNTSPLKYTCKEEVSHIGCGFGFTVISQQHSSELWIFGVNSSLQFDRSSKDDFSKPHSVALPVESLDTRVKQISCGRSHILVLTDKEGAFAIGGNSQGQCGIGDGSTKLLKSFQKLHMPEGENIIKVVCGLDHSIFLTESGKVFSCGWGADGQTGLGHFKDETSIKQVKGSIEDVFIRDVASSVDCCIAVSDKGEVYTWGNSEYDQLGVETEEKQISIATKASLLSHLGKVEHVSAAGSFSVLTTEDGALYTWGYGVLGHGPNVTSSKSPKKIKNADEIGEEISQLHTGLDHTAVVTASGKLFVWGRGSFGRLGLGQETDQWTPKQVILPGVVLEVSCGVDHMGVIVQYTDGPTNLELLPQYKAQPTIIDVSNIVD